jgi:uncharacterized membrane protein
MGKFIVVVCFALIVCGLCAHFAPSTTGHAFNLGPVAINWMMLIALGAVWGGYRLTGK